MSTRATIKHLPGIHVYHDLDDRYKQKMPVYLDFRTPTAKNTSNNDEYVVDEESPWSMHSKETCICISHDAAIALGLFK